jgi:hypothetical protein
MSKAITELGDPVLLQPPSSFPPDCCVTFKVFVAVALRPVVSVTLRDTTTLPGVLPVVNVTWAAVVELKVPGGPESWLQA